MEERCDTVEGSFDHRAHTPDPCTSCFVGHPLIGDTKYGEEKVNGRYRTKYHLKWQLLHAYELIFPKLDPPFEALSKRRVTAPVPKEFYQIIKETEWEHGTQEALEVLH